PGEIKDDMKRSRNEWIDNQMRKLGRVSPEKQLTDTERKALMYQLYKQKQDDLYCMRSVHLDKDGWLPTVTIPNTLTTKQSAFKTYISDYTELPSNIQSKANAKSDKISAYVEYTAGNKSA